MSLLAGAPNKRRPASAAISKQGHTLSIPCVGAHDPRDLLIFPLDPVNTGRSARSTLSSNLGDGELISVWQLGGYWHALAEWQAMCKPYMPTDIELGLDAEG